MSPPSHRNAFMRAWVQFPNVYTLSTICESILTVEKLNLNKHKGKMYK